ncbi:MAG: hypothetical protein IJH12_05310 [Clostridia bacterium]|nr:hypothetical protein [Clostridia bacterium]
MVDIKHANAYSEILEILKYLTPEDYEKIPKEKIEFFEKNANKNYTFNYNPDKTLQEQNVSKTTRIIIGILFRDYWATEEQRDKIVKFQQQERMRAEKEKEEKYSTENLFKNNIKTSENENNEVALVEYKKDKWYKRLIMKINKFFKR